MTWTNEKIIAALSYPGDLLPEDALHEALNRYDDIKQELHAALQLSPDEIIAKEAEADDDYMLPWLANISIGFWPLFVRMRKQLSPQPNCPV